MDQLGAVGSITDDLHVTQGQDKSESTERRLHKNKNQYIDVAYCTDGAIHVVNFALATTSSSPCAPQHQSCLVVFGFYRFLCQP